MKSICLNRIRKDLKEITEFPLEGIGIVSLDNDPKKYIVNMKIMSGVYEGYCSQLLLTFPDNYPIKPPRILLYPGQILDNTYHHHIFRSDIRDEYGHYFNKLCNDLLDNDFLPTSSVYTGWNPSYTISTILLQIQIFLSNPDFPNGYIPEKEKIVQLMKSMDSYEKTFIIRNDKNEEIIKVHTWKNPYPEMYFKNSLNEEKNKIIAKEDYRLNLLKKIKDNLTCYISRLNYIDNRNIILGYPIQKYGDGSLIPIPEILSYDCFIEEPLNNYSNYEDIFINISRFDSLRLRIIQRFHIFYKNKDKYILSSDNSFKSANNTLYHSWLPIYINDEHFSKNKTTILNYFSILKYGNRGLKEFDFVPQNIFEIMINLLDGMINKIIEKDYSSSFLICFFQYAFMFKKLTKKYEKYFIEYQQLYHEQFKTKLLDIKNNFDIKKYILELLILKIFSDDNIKGEILERYEKNIIRYRNAIFFQLFLNNQIDNFINQKLLIKDLNNIGVFYKIFSSKYMNLKHCFFPFASGIKESTFKNYIKFKFLVYINRDFRYFYHSLNRNDKLFIKNIILDELNFSDYINITDIYSSKNFFFTELNESQELISIFEFLRKKLINEEFLNDLENNFGVYLDSAKFIDESKNRKVIKRNDIFNILNNSDLFSIMEICVILSLHSYNEFLFFEHYCYESLNEKLSNLILRLERIFLEGKLLDIKNKQKEMIINNKEKIIKDRILIKNSYDKNYNKRFTKYINKKNITRLLLFKRNHY